MGARFLAYDDGMDASSTTVEGAATAAQTYQGALAPPSDKPAHTAHAACGDTTYDIAIIGLGPAGATLARLLDPRFRIIAIDRKTLDVDDVLGTEALSPTSAGSKPAAFRKPCGGLLAPDAQKALAAFDLTLPADVLVDPQIFSVRVVDVANNLTRYYQRCYVNMDRHRFDQWLIGLIPDSVRTELGASVGDVQRDGGLFHVTYTDADGTERRVSARAVVGADGAFSQVRRLLYPQANLHAYTSIQQWFRDVNPTPFYSCIFDPAVTDCCSWTISKNGYFIFGGAYPAHGAREAFERQKARLAERGFRFGEVLRTEACQVVRPSGPSDIHCGRDGGFLIGEAAGFISASSLEGISFAFDSARILADVLNGFGLGPDSAKRYVRATGSLRRKVIAKVGKAHVIDSPTLRGAIMRSGIGAIRMAPRCYTGNNRIAEGNRI